MAIEALLDRARTQVQLLEPGEVAPELGRYLVVDVREPQEVLQGYLPGAVNVPRGTLEFRASVEPAFDNVRRPILLYSGTGARAALAAVSLQQLGYTRVAALAGGIARWSELDLPIH